ncbi:hypothetical protein [Salinibacter ruber]|uniref:hypothetical protein n=1 Tax=Salinibacter ruber TaxID=146919 RepID=UPI00216A38FB|nr:hypothetical protein [Salinibacter ruber]MCS3613388.1 hypothetical protein [Salinibacter ruber]
MNSDSITPSDYKVYWFARDLVATQFGNYASKEQSTLTRLAEKLREEIENGNSPTALKERIEGVILGSVNRTHGDRITRRYRQTEDLTERILRRIDTTEDVEDLTLAIDAVVRTSEILEETPSFGEDDINRIVDDSLEDERGNPIPSRAYDALRDVDRAGEEYQLGAQREPLIQYIVSILEDDLTDGQGLREISKTITSIAQEYERRVGQSRSSTAGNVFENALQRIFSRFDIPATGKPSHHGDLEVDNMVEGPDGSIGFSCKRTLRERFRQSLPREAEVDVDEVWFVALLMADVSSEKLVDIKNNGGRLYVPRASYVWQSYGNKKRLSYVLRPSDNFVNDVTSFTGVAP